MRAASIVEKIHSEQHACPETGLPIIRRPDWLYMSDQHAYTTGIIADALITTKATGYTDREGVQNYCRIMDDIFAGKPQAGHKYVLLEDYSELKGADHAARKAYIDYFSKQDEHLLAAIFYNTSFQMNLSVRLGKALHIVKFNVELIDSYELALKRAGELLAIDFYQLPYPKKSVSSSSCPAFSSKLEADDFSFSVDVLPPNIIHCAASGTLSQDHLGATYDAQREAARLLGAAVRPFYLVHGLANTAIKDFNTRRQHLINMKSLYADFPFERLIIYGVNRFLRTAILMGIHFVPFDISLVEDFKAALELIDADRHGKADLPADTPCKTAGRLMSAKGSTQDHVDSLMHFIGGIEWDKNGVSRRIDIDPSHPFLPVFDAIAMIKEDLDELLNSRKQTEKQLTQSEEKHRKILEEINDAFFEVDLTGSITFCNHAFCNLVGYGLDEILGMTYQEYVGEGDISGVIEMFTRVYKTGRPEKAVYYVLTRKDGTVLHVETSASIKTDNNGNPVGFRGVVKDISHRKQIEAELVRHRDNLEGLVKEQTSQLRRSKTMLQTILDSMPYGVVIVGTDKLIRYANQSALSLMGHDTEDSVKGLLCHDTFCPAKNGQCPVVDLGKEMDRSERFIKTQTGEEIPVLKSVIQLTLDEEPVLLETFIDIAERKRAEQVLQQSKIDAEAANVAKGQFLANMSHEIRTPLNGIIGMAELALDTTLSPDQRKIVETIDKESNNLLELINTVLDFSKIEARKLQLDKMTFDLRLLIEDVTSSIAMRARDNGLEFVSFVSTNIPAHLIGDPGRLRQVLNNLAGNALKFTETGEILIRAKTVQDRGSSVRIHFEVTDTGIGIDEDRLEAIFEGFTQADGSTTRKYGGTGLGTTISKQLVELMGGEIGVVSKPGQGSTFWFTAVFEKAAQADTLTLKSENGLAGIKVMVVDDMDGARLTIAEYLSLFGCDVHECDRCQTALERLEAASLSSQPFDLLISDIGMPEMDGFDLASAIRSNPNLKEIAILLLSGIGTIGDGEKCRQAGVDGYLNKPVKMAELEKAIKLIRGYGQTAHQQSRCLVTRHTIVENSDSRVRLLLVEDYPTNQQVALNHLRNAGYMVDLAENGQEAVEAFNRHEYRLVLMDMQMPVMDGYEATGVIRKMEADSVLSNAGARRIPIVAMTAHSLKGDREKCMDAGTDDFISKPLKKDKLLDVVEKWIETPPPAPRVAAKVKSAPSDGDGAPMNYAQALEEFDNDPEFLREVLSGFFQNVNGQLITMREAVANGESDVLANEAHSIKGGAANLTADSLANKAKALEMAGKSGSLSQASEILTELAREIRRLESFADTQLA